jgi:hypothetical protein
MQWVLAAAIVGAVGERCDCMAAPIPQACYHSSCKARPPLTQQCSYLGILEVLLHCSNNCGPWYKGSADGGVILCAQQQHLVELQDVIYLDTRDLVVEDHVICSDLPLGAATLKDSKAGLRAAKGE